MQNLKQTLTGLSLISLAMLAGCSLPGVYKIDIQQGNVVTQDMIDQLRPGMTRQQVRFIMGTPLIQDTFHPNRWDYLYSMQAAGGQRKQERVSLVFNGNNQLSGLSGDFMPGASREQRIMGTDSGTSVETAAPAGPAAPTADPETPAAPGSTEDTIQKEIDSARPAAVPTPERIRTDAQ
ncbi:outer membrane protein assembly factor BamE [Pseudomonas oryzihabitans]|uniref:Outer membrane protein assembly factor BamE n=1 Tax=Pseudomonas oryzihabitans TaxID=47885 RepID=A0AAJ2EVV7_9PSED|nr:outer membrane protein assembly factor BamE [Pseudomonas psychrotolerans]MDR6233954.1 outer membrane protein assembly factor BamE [Pseudomonas psychrotolerans]MDR6356960.1 outer membrane protein assembly factor BamE [Pseudomonas psychrotolerans]